jgi:hypothetical protein
MSTAQIMLHSEKLGEGTALLGAFGIGASFLLSGSSLIMGATEGKSDIHGGLAMPDKYWKRMWVGTGGILASVGLVMVGLVLAGKPKK